jgi:hypothetical protein
VEVTLGGGDRCPELVSDEGGGKAAPGREGKTKEGIVETTECFRSPRPYTRTVIPGE